MPLVFHVSICQLLECKFDTLYDKFKMYMTQKIHVIVDQYGDYFKETGKTFRFTNGQHHEAIHHAIKVFEAKRGFNQKKKNLGSLIHQAKCLQSIVTFNVLYAGYVKQEAMRLTPARKRLSSTSSSPASSPRKGFNLKKTY